jgi:hypothetical protein
VLLRFGSASTSRLHTLVARVTICLSVYVYTHTLSLSHSLTHAHTLTHSLSLSHTPASGRNGEGLALSEPDERVLAPAKSYEALRYY